LNPAQGCRVWGFLCYTGWPRKSSTDDWITTNYNMFDLNELIKFFKFEQELFKFQMRPCSG
jgi:hypothetical protein